MSEEYNNFIPIRITDNKQFSIEDLLKFCAKHSALVLVKEYKDIENRKGEHYHGWLQADISLKTVVNWLKTELKCKGNRDYSISGKDIRKFNGETEAYKRYCCKGEGKDLPPECFFNIKEDLVRRFHKEFYEQQEQFKQKIKESKKEIKEQLLDYIKEGYEVDNVIQLIRKIIRFFVERDKSVSNYQIENYVHYIRHKLEPNYINIRANLIHDKMYSRLN